MLITQKHKYALRAVFELAKRGEETPIKLGDIAESQAIPTRFLEVIMGRLRSRGLVTSKRGFTGGYRLTKPPSRISVGEIFRLLEPAGDRVRCNACMSREECPLTDDCPFIPLWDQVQAAVTRVYDKTTISDLMARNLPGDPQAATGKSTGSGSMT